MYDFKYIGNGLGLMQAKNGMHYVFSTMDRGVALNLILRGEHEPHITTLIRDHLNEGERAIVVGSNIGYHDVYVAYTHNVNGFHWSFEPLPELVPMIHWNLELNGVWNRGKVVQKALSDFSGEATFYRIKYHAGTSSLFNRPENDWIDATEREEIRVEVSTLDEELRDVKGDIKLLKIDAEGSDWKVIAGGLRVIEDNGVQVIILEHYPGAIDADRVFKVLVSLGFNAIASSTEGGIKAVRDISELQLPVDLIMFR